MTGTQPISDEKCLCCGYPKLEENCETYRIISYKMAADFIIVLCGREGITLYEKKGKD